MTSGDYEKDIQERINLISSLVKKSFIDYKELLEEKDFKKYIGTQYFEEQFQTVRINLPMRRGIPDAAILFKKNILFLF
jgi:hypothetical protein